MTIYYETEIPIEAISEPHGEVRYFRKAGKIQISRPKWISAHDGALHHGKTVTINIYPFAGDPSIISLLEKLLDDLRDPDISDT